MELCSLHPFDESVVREIISNINGSGVASTPNVERAWRALALVEQGQDRGRYEFTHALALELADRHPSFAHHGVSLTSWEARVDRGVGMLMRPPARLMIDAGMNPALARTLPIRLDLSRGMMGGAYIPARLMEDLERLLDNRLERSVRRLIDAEWDGVAVLGLMFEAVAYTRSNGLALYEAMDVVTPVGSSLGASNARVVTADPRRLDKSLRQRLEIAAKPPKKPGLWARLSGRGKSPPNGPMAGEGDRP